MMEDNLSSSHRGFEWFSFLARADMKKLLSAPLCYPLFGNGSRRSFFTVQTQPFVGDDFAEKYTAAPQSAASEKALFTDH